METAFSSACFIYPDHGEGSRFDRMFPPLGLELVAAGVKDCLADRTMIDLRFEEDWQSRIPPDVDVIALSILWDTPTEQILALSRHLKNIRPGVMVVAGGRVAEANNKTLVSAGPEERVNVVFSGPDDGRFRELVEHGTPDKVSGVTFIRDGECRQTPFPPYKAIPDHPLPDRSLRRVRYGVIRHDGLDLGMATDAIQTSRGCPFHCAFCTFNRDSEGRQIQYTARSPESIADELEEIEARYVTIVDDLAFHRPERMEHLCDVLLQRNIKKRFAIETRINMGMRPEVVRKMARAGFRYVTFGIESMHDHVLEFLDKGLTRKMIEKAFARIQDVPMIFIANFIIGSVGETREEMLQIPGFAKQIGLDSIMVHPLRCRGPEPLTEKVKAAPGYHIHPKSKRVYSDDLSAWEINQIAKQIKREFWTPAQKLKTAWKVQRLLLEPFSVPLAAGHWLQWHMQGKPDPWGNKTTSATSGSGLATAGGSDPFSSSIRFQ